jgi:hypothetical protein
VLKNELPPAECGPVMQEHGMGKYVLPLTLLFCAVSVQAQSNPAASETPPIPRKAVVTEVVASDVAPAVSWEDPRQKIERAQIVNAIMERQIALRRDTEKLLFLAEELKQNVAKTGPHVLSMDVIKKAQEIEKLAKSVKDKMKDAY